MSNRYILEGLKRDVQAGNDILILGARRTVSRHTFINLSELLQDDINTHPIHTIKVSQGREEVRLHNGGRVRTSTLGGVRGTTPDIIVLLDWEQITTADPETFAARLDSLRATGAELIQA